MAQDAFDDIRLPMDIERGARFIRQTRTLTTRLANGFAVRNQQWAQRLSQWDIKYALQEMTGATLELGISAVDKFHDARHGSSRTFRFRDWTDYKLQDEVIGFADGLKSVFQITQTTTDFANFTASKIITKPSQAPGDPAWEVKISGVPFGTEGVDWTINYSTGVLTFTTPPAGTGVEPITVTGFFDKHASFLEDELTITLEWVQSGEIDNIIIQEER
jgi:uncharacterized protein (TIGR02217 family)